MARSDFSEKVYEALFLHELLNTFMLPDKTPFFVPSQALENTLACDLCFYDINAYPINRKVIFIQFKISYEFPCPPNGEPFKFDLYKDKYGNFKQHNRLCDYNANCFKIAGVYAAPKFVKGKDLYDKLISGRIILDSTIFMPTQKVYGGTHYVDFGINNPTQHSNEAKEYQELNFEQLLNIVEPVSCEEFKKQVKKYLLMQQVECTSEINRGAGYYIFI